MEHKEHYIKYIQSKSWEKIRLRIIKQRKSKCENCGSTEHLQVHHKTYKNLFNEKDNDLQVLCRSCHYSVHNFGKLPSKTPAFYSSYSTDDLLDVYDNRKGCCDICGERKAWLGHFYIFNGDNVLMGCKKHFPRWIWKLMQNNIFYVDEYLLRIKNYKKKETSCTEQIKDVSL